MPVLPRAYVESPLVFFSVPSLGQAMLFLLVVSFRGCFMFKTSHKKVSTRGSSPVIVPHLRALSQAFFCSLLTFLELEVGRLMQPSYRRGIVLMQHSICAALPIFLCDHLWTGYVACRY